MAVLIEAISVVFRKENIDEKFPGGWKRFVDDVPNRTLFSDGNIGCVGFMHPDDVGQYVLYLESLGLDFKIGDKTKDIAVVDQIRGFTVPTDWLKFGEVEKDGNRVKACWLVTEEPGHIFARRGWAFEGSLSARSGFVESDDLEERVRFLRQENGLEVFLDLETGKEFYLGRPSLKGQSRQELLEELEAICSETLALELEAEKARRQNDPGKGVSVFSKLVDDLLPRVEEISAGVGKNMAFAHYSHGLVLRVLKQPDAAEPKFKRANELNPNLLITLLELVRCLGEQGKHEEALPYARAAVTVSPHNPACLGNLAMCLLLVGEKEEARTHIELALKIDPNDAVNNLIYSNFE